MAIVQAYDDNVGADLDRRPMNELRRIRDQKIRLLQQLEDEKNRLEQPSDLEMRVTMLEGAVEMAEKGDKLDEEVKAAFLRRFVEDLRDDHHHNTAVIDVGAQARRMPHGVVLDIPDHPILAEDRMRAEDEMMIRKMPSAMERHPAYSRPGAMSEYMRLVPNPWNEKGYDYRNEAGFEKSVWNAAQEDINSMVEFDEAVAQRFDESFLGEVYNDVKQGVMNAIPISIKEAFTKEEIAPVPYGCGDVFVDKDMAKATGRCMRKQMAQAGLQVFGDAPPVTKEWLEENNIIRGKKKRGEAERMVPSDDSAITRALASPDMFAQNSRVPPYMPQFTNLSNVARVKS